MDDASDEEAYWLGSDQGWKDVVWPEGEEEGAPEEGA